MKRRFIEWFSVAVLATAGLWSCSDDHLEGTESAGVAQGDKVTFVIDIPGHTDPATRAIPEGGTADNDVRTVTILLFNATDGKYFDFVRPLGAINTVAGSEFRKTFTVLLPEGDFGVLVLANADDMLTGDFDLEANKTALQVQDMSYFERGLVRTLDVGAKWIADPAAAGYKPFPMAALYAIPADRASMDPIHLTRMLAKINLKFDTPAISSQFTLKEIRLCNYNRSGTLVPGDYGGGAPSVFNNADLNLPTAPNSPDKAVGLANALVYSGAALAGNRCVDEIFLPEAAAVSEANWQDGVCLLV